MASRFSESERPSNTRTISGDAPMAFRALSGDRRPSEAEGMLPIASLQDGEDYVDSAAAKSASNNKMLALSFAAMVGIGLMNKIFQKLQTIPMCARLAHRPAMIRCPYHPPPRSFVRRANSPPPPHPPHPPRRYNYPNFLNLLTTGMYIPLSFAYVIPAIRAGWIGEDQFAVPKRDFAVMGFLDCLAGIMQIFAATYVRSLLLVLALDPTAATIPRAVKLHARCRRAQWSRE